AARRPANVWSGLEPRIAKRASAIGWGFVLCLVALTVGCTGGPKRSTKHVDVSGQVTYNGKPVTGGEVSFVAEGGFSSKGIIDKNGNYTISAPVGNVKISVNNTMLSKGAGGEGTKHSTGMKGAGKPRSDASEARKLEGTYIRLPTKYLSVDTSPLTYVVKNETQTYNIELTD